MNALNRQPYLLYIKYSNLSSVTYWPISTVSSPALQRCNVTGSLELRDSAPHRADLRVSLADLQPQQRQSFLVQLEDLHHRGLQHRLQPALKHRAAARHLQIIALPQSGSTDPVTSQTLPAAAAAAAVETGREGRKHIWIFKKKNITLKIVNYLTITTSSDQSDRW